MGAAVNSIEWATNWHLDTALPLATKKGAAR